jgi:hypothetical protein
MPVFRTARGLEAPCGQQDPRPTSRRSGKGCGLPAGDALKISTPSSSELEISTATSAELETELEPGPVRSLSAAPVGETRPTTSRTGPGLEVWRQLPRLGVRPCLRAPPTPLDRAAGLLFIASFQSPAPTPGGVRLELLRQSDLNW